MVFSPLDDYLAAQLAAGQTSHAYIFSGKAADEQALSLTAALLCRNPDDLGNGCGRCPVCTNLLAGTYPDCRVIEPAGAQHKVEHMRALVAAAGLAPLAGLRKVFIIHEAEKISDEAANTLLKLLEEPAPDTTIILLTAQPESLLPTILSRCQMFVFGTRLQLAEPELPPELLMQAEEWLRSLSQQPLYEMLREARVYDGDRAGQNLFFFALLSVLHRAACGEICLPFTPKTVLRSATVVERALELLGKNINQKLLTDVVYLRLWQNAQQ